MREPARHTHSVSATHGQTQGRHSPVSPFSYLDVPVHTVAAVITPFYRGLPCLPWVVVLPVWRRILLQHAVREWRGQNNGNRVNVIRFCLAKLLLICSCWIRYLSMLYIAVFTVCVCVCVSVCVCVCVSRCFWLTEWVYINFSLGNCQHNTVCWFRPDTRVLFSSYLSDRLLYQNALRLSNKRFEWLF